MIVLLLFFQCGRQRSEREDFDAQPFDDYWKDPEEEFNTFHTSFTLLPSILLRIHTMHYFPASIEDVSVHVMMCESALT